MLVVDPERKRISLTAKKTLLDSTLSIISKVEDAVPGAVAHAVVFKLNENNLLIEFYNNVKAIVPSREIRYAGMYLLTLPFLTNAYVVIPLRDNSLSPSLSADLFEFVYYRMMVGASQPASGKRHLLSTLLATSVQLKLVTLLEERCPKFIRTMLF